jgi:hypothetical protein
MRALLLIVLSTSASFAEPDRRIVEYVDETLTLPPPERERPKVKVRIEPAPRRPKSKVKP